MSTSKPIRIWFYLFGINGFVICAGFLIFIIISLKILEHSIVLQTQQNLQTFSYAIRQLLIAESFNNCEDERIENLVKLLAAHDPSFRITIINENGTVIGDSDANPFDMENHLSRPEVQAALNGDEGYATRQSSVSRKKVIYYAIPFIINSQRVVLRLSMPLASNVLFFSSIKQDSIFAALLIVCVIMILSVAVSRRIMRPLTELRNAAFRYRNGEFSYCPNIEDPYEFVELSHDLKRMALTIENNIEDISRRRDYFESVFAHTAESLIVFSRDLQIIELNRAACRLFAPSPSEKSRSLISLIRNTEIIDFVHKIMMQPLSEQDEEKEIILQDQTNAEHYLLVRCSTISSGNAQECFLLMLTDVTRLKQLEQIRKDFVANVSHELKTPVTSIKGFIETLLDGALNDKKTARHFLEIAEQQTGRLINIISDLLTLSQLEQNGFIIRTQTIQLRIALEEAIQICLPAAQQKHIKIHLSFYDSHGHEKKESPSASLNEGLFIQVVENIIDNAVKYCPSHSCIDIGVQQTEPPGILIWIEDTGPGIPDEYKTRVFERFFRVDKGRSRETGGTGLGLSIVRHIVELHGGTIQAMSRKDGMNGARFEMFFPGTINSI